MLKKIIPVVALFGLVMAVCSFAKAANLAAEPAKITKTESAKTETIVFAGGCFWGVEAVYDHIKGVVKATSGFAGGDAATAHYERVSDGDTGHAESVQVVFDPSVVSLNQLLDVYFDVAHDPTQLNHQGPDQGTQYRSEVFVTTPAQQNVVKQKISELGAAHHFSEAIVTKVEPLKAFYAAEDYHQNYLALHPTNPYILINDLPKVAKLRISYPQLYKD